MIGDTRSYLEDFDAIVETTPYWMKEVHGKYLINRLREFIIKNGGDTNRNIKKVIAQQDHP